MRLIPVIAVAIGLLIPRPSFGQGWTEYVSQQDFFTANFPGEPEVSDITFQSEYAMTLPGKVYSHEKRAINTPVTSPPRVGMATFALTAGIRICGPQSSM